MIMRFAGLIVAFIGFCIPVQAADIPAMEKTFGETVYIPAYSRIYAYEGRSNLLAATLTVHNVDPVSAVELHRVAYFGEDGTELAEMLEAPKTLAPFESVSYLVPINDTRGGVGANFIVEWRAQTRSLSPLAEAVMVSAPGTPGPSFTSRGRVIERHLSLD